MLKVLTDFFQLFMISTGRQIENYIVFRQNVKETQRFQDSISRQQVPQKKKEQKTNKKKTSSASKIWPQDQDHTPGGSIRRWQRSRQRIRDSVSAKGLLRFGCCLTALLIHSPEREDTVAKVIFVGMALPREVGHKFIYRTHAVFLKRWYTKTDRKIKTKGKMLRLLRSCTHDMEDGAKNQGDIPSVNKITLSE